MRVLHLLAAAAVAAASCPALAQDVRGLENCAAEKQMERRTGCLQANTEFLHQVIQKLTRDGRQRREASAAEAAALRRELAAAKDEIAALKEAVARLRQQAQDAAQKPQDKKP